MPVRGDAFFLQSFTPLLIFESSNALLVFYRKRFLRITFAGGFFVVRCQDVWLQRYYENSVRDGFLEMFRNFGKWLLFERLADYSAFINASQLTCFCSKSTVETLEKGLKYVQS